MEFPTLPTAFCQRLHTQMSHADAEGLCNALNDTSSMGTSLRINPFKPIPAPNGASPIAWCKGGYTLAERPAFTQNPLFHAGCFYVQEAASMSIALAYEAMDEKPALLLDLCAAPGGKSTLWRSLMPTGTLLVANEPVRQRAMILRENMQKWGHPDMLVCSDYPKQFASLNGLFDAIATDVPCSGEGMFRKDTKTRSEWSLQIASMCAQRSREIVADVWPALRTGGYLVFSTCTFNPAENEDNVRWICEHLGAEVIPLSSSPSWGINADDGMLRFLPHRTIGEGFFLALLRKGAKENTLRLRKAEKPLPLPRKWINTNGEFIGIQSADDTLAALRQTLLPAATAIRQNIKTIATGTDVATIKGKKQIPAHALALSTIRSDTAFPQAELSLDESLQYLSRQALQLKGTVPKGYVLTTYKGHPLGFLNNLGARANNLYPAEWRIRHLPR